jgi:YihY family inner membrane protein
VKKRLDCYQRTHEWLGFLVATAKKFGEDEAGNLAALISYYAFFSLFPLLLALVTMLGFVLHGNPDLQHRIVDSALAQFPVVGDQIRSNIGSLGGNWPALIVGLAGALWAGMAAIDVAQIAVNSVWDLPIRERPKFIRRKLRSLLMLVIIGGGLFLTGASSVVANTVDSAGVAGRIVGPFLSTVINIGLFAAAFRVLTQRNLGWSDVAPGAAVAGIAATLFQVAGGLIVVRYLRSASQTYGTFAVVIGLLSWLHLQAQVVLFAAEINVVRARRLWPRSLIGEDMTEADRKALAEHAEVEERVPEEVVRVAIAHRDGRH